MSPPEKRRSLWGYNLPGKACDPYGRTDRWGESDKTAGRRAEILLS